LDPRFADEVSHASVLRLLAGAMNLPYTTVEKLDIITATNDGPQFLAVMYAEDTNMFLPSSSVLFRAVAGQAEDTSTIPK
jgi:hypothetical protein